MVKSAKTEPKQKSSESKRRIVIKISKDKMEDMDVLSALFGQPQYVIVEKAFTEYIRQNKKAIDGFKAIRKEITEKFKDVSE